MLKPRTKYSLLVLLALSILYICLYHIEGRHEPEKRGFNGKHYLVFKSVADLSQTRDDVARFIPKESRDIWIFEDYSFGSEDLQLSCIVDE